MINPFGKRRPVQQPYEVYEGQRITYLVLKKYQLPEKESSNPYARWLTAGRSAYSHGYEQGDMYAKDIKTLNCVWRESDGKPLPAKYLTP